MKVFVDADGCPNVVRDILERVAVRGRAEVVLVANRVIVHQDVPGLSSIVVGAGADVADDWIAGHVGSGDLVITGDIPLAGRVVDSGATAIDFRGDVYTADNVRERLSVRDFMHGLRESGVQTGGPSAFGPRDRQMFANALDRLLARAPRS